MSEDSSNGGEKLAFLNGLKQYLEDKGKILLPYPRLAGKVVDLHDLYNKVTSLGGYQKVTDKDLWDTFLTGYNFNEVSSTLSYGLKTIYQRFLEAYESVHYFGDDDTLKKPRLDASLRQSRKPTHISEYHRVQHGLSRTRLSESRFANLDGDYERLAFSLISCLPNEVDFAINACTLLSGESRHVLRLARCPQILEALLLHAGIVSSASNCYAGIAEEWNKKTKHDLIQFWKDTVQDNNIIQELLLDPINAASVVQKLPDSKSSLTTSLEKMNSDNLQNLQEYDKTVESSKSSVSGESLIPMSNDVCLSCTKPVNTESDLQQELNLQTNSHKWSSLLQSKRDPGVQDYEGQRILQIALVLLNLSFESFNVSILACSKPFIRFVFLCIHSNYASLRQTGLDILGNISSNLELLDLGLDITQCTYKTLQECILSFNKFDQIRGFEILGNVCHSQNNKDSLIMAISDKVYDAAVRILTLCDVELLLAAVEALYGMSKLGEETCTRIMLVPGSIDILVCLVTINIREFGSQNLAKIRIARKVPPVAPPAPTVSAYQPQQRIITPHYPQVVNVVSPVVIAAPQPIHPQYHPPASVHVPVTIPQPPVQPVLQKREMVKSSSTSLSVEAAPVYTHTESQFNPPVFHYMPAPPPDIAQDKSPESFAQLWVWSSYTACKNDEGSVPRVQVFAEYAAAASRYGMCSTKQVLPAAEFGRCLQQVFPRTVSRLFNDSNGQPLYHITGIRKRATPLPVPGHHPQDSASQADVVMKSQPITVPLSIGCTVKSAMKSTIVSEPTPMTTSPAPVRQVSTSETSITASTTSSLTKQTCTPSVSSSSNNNSSSTNHCTATARADVASRLTKSTTQVTNCDSGLGLTNQPENTSKNETLHNTTPTSTETLVSDAETICCQIKSTKTSKTVFNHTYKNHTQTSVYNSSVKMDVSNQEQWKHANNIDHGKSDSKTKFSPEILPTHSLPNGTNETNSNNKVTVSDTPVPNGSPSTLNSTIKSNIKESTINETDIVVGSADVKLCNGEVMTPSNEVSMTKSIEKHGAQAVEASIPKHNKINGITSPGQTSCKEETALTNGNFLPLPPQTINADGSAASLQCNSSVQVSLESSTNHVSADVTAVNNQFPLTHHAQEPATSHVQVAGSSCLKRPFPVTTPQPTEQLKPKVMTASSELSSSPALTINSGHHDGVVQRIPSMPSQAPAPPKQQLISNHLVRTSMPLNAQSHPVALFSSRLPTAPHLPQAAQRKLPTIDLMAPNASLMVLFRNCGKHSFEDSSDEKEDPISRSIRLTAVLTLANIGHYSDEGRSLVKRYESRLAYLAMSGMDCSPTIARLLSELDR